MMVKNLTRKFMGRRNASHSFLLFLLSILTFSCGERKSPLNEDVNINKRLTELIMKSSDTIEIGNNFRDEFDTLYIFSPYYPIDSIEKQTKIDLNDLTWGRNLRSHQKDLASVNENTNLLLFKKNGTLNKYCLYQRVEGDFSKITKQMFLSKDATFVKKIAGDSTRRWLYLINTIE